MFGRLPRVGEALLSAFVCNCIISFLFCVSSANAQTANPVNLTCCRLISEPFVYRSDEGQLTGWSSKNFDDLLYGSSQNFTCAANQTIENMSNDEFIEKFAKCGKNSRQGEVDICNCDIGVGSFWKTRKRINLVDFLAAYGDNSLYLITEKSNLKEKNNSENFFIRAFDPAVWMNILGLIIFFTVLHLLDERFANQEKTEREEPNNGQRTRSPDEEDVSVFQRLKRGWRAVRRFLLKNYVLRLLRRSFLATLGKLVGFNLNDESERNQTMRMWLLSYVIILSGIFLILVYEAAMIATLLQEGSEPNKLSIHHIKDCAINNSDICFKTNEGIEEYWKNIISVQSCQKASKYQPKTAETYDELIQMVANYSSKNPYDNSTCKYMFVDGGIGGRAIREKIDGKCGGLKIIGGPFLTREVSFIVQRKWDYTSDLSATMLNLQSLGKFNEKLDDYIAKSDKRASKCNISDSDLVIDFLKLKYFFYFIFIVCAILFFVMLDNRRPTDKLRDINTMDKELREFLFPNAEKQSSQSDDSRQPDSVGVTFGNEAKDGKRTDGLKAGQEIRSSQTS